MCLFQRMKNKKKGVNCLSFVPLLWSFISDDWPLSGPVLHNTVSTYRSREIRGVFTKLKINSLDDNATSLKDGTSFCFCAYVLRISGWSERLGFPEDGTY